jgi:hypothetical protein
MKWISILIAFAAILPTGAAFGQSTTNANKDQLEDEIGNKTGFSIEEKIMICHGDFPSPWFVGYEPFPIVSYIDDIANTKRKDYRICVESNSGIVEVWAFIGDKPKKLKLRSNTCVDIYNAIHISVVGLDPAQTEENSNNSSFNGFYCRMPEGVN